MNVMQEGKAAVAKAFRDRCLAEVRAGRKSVDQFLREMGVSESKLESTKKQFLQVAKI